MKKRISTLLVSILAALCFLFGFASCGKVEFKVNFVVDGAVYDTINTNGKEIIKMPENPEKDEYTFDGWYWDKDTWQTPFAANSLLDAPLSSDVNVYCKWKPNVVHVESVTLNERELSVHVGDERILSATVLPNNATDATVVWESSNTTIATVVGGKVTALRIGNATITATTTDGGKTALCEITVTEDKISFNTLTVNGESVYGKVSNATTTFSFIREITEHGNVEYNVYKEITCETLIASKTISLEVGDNTVYILQTVGKQLKLYTVTVRRRPMYTVSFNSNGGTAVDSQTIEEDFCANEPTTTRVGYTFDKWDFDFTTPITSNTTIAAKWTANTNTPYKVEYYLQNLENDEYTLETTENKTGTTDTTATAEIKTFAHFTYNESASTISGNIDGNGSRVLKVYYTRDQYTVTFDGNGGTLTSGNATQTVKYGGAAVAPTVTKTGYSVEKWDKSLSNISESQTITAQWTVNQYTVTFAYGNGQVYQTITQDYNTKITVQDPTLDGYTFDGWDKELIVPAHDTTITAKWLAIFRVYGDSITGLTDHGKTFTEIVVPSEIDGVKITSIGEGAFEYCSGLASVTIGNGVTEIGESAFECCSGLTSVTIPDSVTSIGNGAFYGCSRLQEITIPFVGAKAGKTAKDTYQYPFGYIFGTSSYTGGTATKQYYYGDSRYSTTSTTYYIPSSLKKVTVTGGNILRGAFYCCSGLTSVTIPDGVTSIGNNGFSGCSGLTSVTIPDSVTSIGNNGFSGCSGLTSVTIGNGVTSIGSYTFYGCSKLANITFRDTTTWYRTNTYNNWVNKRNGTSVNVTNSSTNATYFTSTYVDYYWYRK